MSFGSTSSAAQIEPITSVVISLSLASLKYQGDKCQGVLGDGFCQGKVVRQARALATASLTEGLSFYLFGLMISISVPNWNNQPKKVGAMRTFTVASSVSAPRRFIRVCSPNLSYTGLVIRGNYTLPPLRRSPFPFRDGINGSPERGAVSNAD